LKKCSQTALDWPAGGVHISGFMVGRICHGNRLRPSEKRRLVSSLLGTLARAGIELCSMLVGVALAVAAIAASAQPSDNIDSVAPPTPAQQPVSKSDEQRIVGKVLELDRDAGRAKLATDEGAVILDVPEQAVRAFRVGDTVSISESSIKLRSASPRAVSADEVLRTTHPRTKPPSSRRFHSPASTRAIAS
jgi:hypothetical protein